MYFSKKYNILKIHDLIVFSQLKVMHSFIWGELPTSLSDKFAYDHNNAMRDARVARHFLVPFGGTNYRTFSLFISAPDIWNTFITSKIRYLKDVPRSKSFFKTVVKKLLIEKY